jgi:hypothetical protein
MKASGKNYVIPQLQKNPKSNAKEVILAYDDAIRKIDSGELELSEKCRFKILLLPGEYFFENPIVISKDFIDFEGFSKDCYAVNFKSKNELFQAKTNSLDYCISNITIEEQDKDLFFNSGKLTLNNINLECHSLKFSFDKPTDFLLQIKNCEFNCHNLDVTEIGDRGIIDIIDSEINVFKEFFGLSYNSNKLKVNNSILTINHISDGSLKCCGWFDDSALKCNTRTIMPQLNFSATRSYFDNLSIDVITQTIENSKFSNSRISHAEKEAMLLLNTFIDCDLDTQALLEHSKRAIGNIFFKQT